MRIVEVAQDLADSEQWPEAVSKAQEALRMMQANGSPTAAYQVLMYNVLGDGALEMGDYLNVLEYYDQSKNLLELQDTIDTKALSEVLNKIGNYHLTMQDYRAALSYLERARDLRLQAGASEDLQMSHIYYNLGLGYLYLGDFDQALEYHRESFRIRSKQLRAPHGLLSQSLQGLAQCYQDKGDREGALAAYQQALSQYLSLDHHQDLRLGDLYLNLGTAYYDLAVNDDLHLAITYFEEAQQTYQSLGDQALAAQGLSFNNLANAYLRQGDLNRALDYYEKALSIQKREFGPIHPDVAQTLFNLGQCYYIFLERPDLSIPFFSEALQALDYRSNDDDRFDKVNAHQILLFTLYYLGGAQFSNYRNSGAVTTLQDAEQTFSALDQLMDYLRIRYDGLGSKLNLVANGHRMYDDAINVALELRRITGEEKYWHFAFRYSEKSKGLLLLDGLQKTKARSFGEVPASRLEEINILESRIADLDKDHFIMSQNTNSSQQSLDSIDNLIFISRREFERTLHRLGEDFPRYFNLRYGSFIPPASQLQQDLLSENQTLIEYFLGDTVLQIFIVNEDAVEAVSVNLTLEFYEALDTFNFSIRKFGTIATADIAGNLKSYIGSATVLYQYLMAPIQDLLREHLIVVPDGKLGFLAFDALLTGPVENINDFKSHPYLLRKHSLSYDYSASLLAEMRNNHTSKNLKTYLGFAPSFLPSNQAGLAELLYNQEEVSSALKELGGRAFISHEATKANFLAFQNQYSIVHLATHGKVNVQQEDFSFLAFTADDRRAPGQDLLYVREIYNLPVRANLVILSACETGDGRLLEGEGIASIARGFSYAGAKSLLATRWPVNDKTTSLLVTSLLKNLKSHLRKDEALNQATLQYIDEQNNHYAHPFYWASFMMIGDIEQIDLSADLFWKATTVSMIILLMIMGYIIYENRRKLDSTMIN
jgi:CHAT domain-containing protein/Tfp pilus assembly protein PilF